MFLTQRGSFSTNLRYPLNCVLLEVFCFKLLDKGQQLLLISEAGLAKESLCIFFLGLFKTFVALTERKPSFCLGKAVIETINVVYNGHGAWLCNVCG